jgi:hypothetical protein
MLNSLRRHALARDSDFSGQDEISNLTEETDSNFMLSGALAGDRTRSR